MMIFSRYIDKEALEKSKIIVEIIAIVLAGIFAVWKWGFTSYWDREESFRISVDSTVDKGTFLKESLIYIEGSNYCLLEGALRVSNYSRAPIHIENSTISFFPFKRNQCLNENDSLAEGCLVSNTISSIVDRECGESRKGCTSHESVVIRPVDDQPLFGKTDATRSFNAALPMSKFLESDSILLVIEQQIGRGCIDPDSSNHTYADYLRFCNTSRVFLADTNACNG
jgi:hypothetical protein